MLFSLNIHDSWIGLGLNGSIGCRSCETSPRDDRQDIACKHCRVQWSWLGVSLKEQRKDPFDKWYRNEPTGDDRCGRLSTQDNRTGAWYGYDCEKKLPYICKHGKLYASSEYLFSLK